MGYRTTPRRNDQVTLLDGVKTFVDTQIRMLDVPSGRTRTAFYAKIVAGKNHFPFMIEIPPGHPDGVGGAFYCNNYGGGDAIFIALAGAGAVGLEASSFVDGTKGIISTSQGDFPNSVLFNALWERQVGPAYGMYYADQTWLHAFTSRLMSGAPLTGVNMRIVSNDLLTRYLGLYNNGTIESRGDSVWIPVTLAQFTGNQNDLAIGTGKIFRLSADAPRDLTGIAGGSDGREIDLVNVGAQPISMKNQDAGSSAINRVITGTGAAVTLAADVTRSLWYDGTTQRWRLKG